MLQILLSSFITIVFTAVGVLVGMHLGRRYYGLTDRWHGWAAEIDVLVKIIRGKNDF